MPPSFDLENFMKSHVGGDTGVQSDSPSDSRPEHPESRSDIDVESFLRSQVDIHESKPGEQSQWVWFPQTNLCLMWFNVNEW